MIAFLDRQSHESDANEQSAAMNLALCNMVNELLPQASFEQLSSLIPIDYKTTRNLETGVEREHLLLTTEVNGTRQVFWYSGAPEPDGQNLAIVARPGLGEIVERGIGWHFHKELADRNPHAATISLATEGFGPAAEDMTIQELASTNFTKMAQNSLDLLKNLVPNMDLVLVGTSMGTVINNKMALLNNKLPEQDRLIIGKIVKLANALVDPSKIFTDMALSFVPSMLIDGGLELLARTKPSQMREQFSLLVESRPRPRDILPAGRYTLGLLCGTPEAEISEVAETHDVTVISGKLDSLFDQPMWSRQRAAVHVIPNRGHAIALNPTRGALRITREIKPSLLVA